ncbi:ROK family protein, partial [Micromonospora chalcea]|uniref:ROK family protein n=1 Tax=Micromonospora chalcea TaxID=1874 RepID=UPI0033E9D064
TAGILDPATGANRYATDSLPGWAGTPVADELAARLGRPVRVTNDVAAAALGECWAGAGRGRGHVPLLPAALGADAVVVGAARLATAPIHHDGGTST